MTELTKNIYAVEVPEDARSFLINKTGNDVSWEYDIIKGEIGCRTGRIGLEELPDGQWQILGTVTNGVVDFDCEGLVKSEIIEMPLIQMRLYMDYMSSAYNFANAKTSFIALLQSKSLDTTKRYLIIQRL